jgi:hypothetical protein
MGVPRARHLRLSCLRRFRSRRHCGRLRRAPMRRLLGTTRERLAQRPPTPVRDDEQAGECGSTAPFARRSP